MVVIKAHISIVARKVLENPKNKQKFAASVGFLVKIEFKQLQLVQWI